MLQTLEELEPRLKTFWRKNVSLHELTVLSVSTSPGTALLLTNKALYLLRKRFFGVKMDSWKVSDLIGAGQIEGGICIGLAGSELKLDFSPEKNHLCSKVAEIINERIAKSRPE